VQKERDLKEGEEHALGLGMWFWEKRKKLTQCFYMEIVRSIVLAHRV